jgi:sortase A
MPLTRSIEKALRLTGSVLLLAYLFFQVTGYVRSQAGLLSFQLHRGHDNQIAQSGDHHVDFSLWSPKRIQAYENALLAKLESPLAVLSIPKLDIEVPVYEGTDELTLNRGAGRIAGTARPGEGGNMGIAAHRDGFFRKLKDIAKGDRVEIKTNSANFEYVVDDVEIVDPGNVSVLDPRAKPTLTLVTCYPFYFVGSAPKRYIVHASRVELKNPTPSKLNSQIELTTSEDMP